MCLNKVKMNRRWRGGGRGENNGRKKDEEEGSEKEVQIEMEKITDYY